MTYLIRFVGKNMNKQDLIDLHFKGATELYKSELIEKDDYYIFSNLLIDNCYWNMGILKNFDTDINLVWENIKKELQKRNRNPEIYIIPYKDYKLNPYEAVNDGYGTALYNSFQNLESEYKSIHYAGKYNREIVSTATVVYKKENAIIYNVTTKKQYQKMGICKEMMSYIISDLREKGVKNVCVQTEQGYYTEKAYANMGFKEIMLGRVFVKDN